MNPVIEITISPTGESRIETKGFRGSACQQASKFIERALGKKTGETLTAAFIATAESESQNRTAAGQ